MSGAPKSFRDAVEATLGFAPDAVQPGKFHRFSTSNRRGDTAGWCLLFDDLRGGVFGCFRQGVRETWRAEGDELTMAESTALRQQRAAAAAKREIDQLVMRAKAGVRNAQDWEKCVAVTAIRWRCTSSVAA